MLMFEGARALFASDVPNTAVDYGVVEQLNAQMALAARELWQGALHRKIHEPIAL
jgi:hypothetical protein